MIDFYVDDVELIEIRNESNKQVFHFKNKKKDESLLLVIKNENLVNLLDKLQVRCETLNLIKRKDYVAENE